ncbi:hypothetical protein [Blautia sp. CAG:257]|uniref:hypothetical protein n=1 Tax=Blautia sp. CAG:257 TaxID=1262756 RepID=UPI002583A1F0|nr:hypothetical protein [Blautia sp. CAG:257]
MMKKLLCAAVLATTLICSSSTVHAGTIPFTVTVGGTGSQDPLSKRERKTDDGDTFAYFRGQEFSADKAGIYVRSYNLDKEYIYSGQRFLVSTTAGIRQSAQYNMTAPGGEYYYMKSEAQSKRVTVKGYYCP